MVQWLKLEIPEELLGEERVTGNDYIKTYKTEILLPQDSEYPGYCFLHPSKLIHYNSPIASIAYNESFTFTLIKKEREPGKKYKRYVLTAPELPAIYEPVVAKTKAKLETKEQKRLAQIGDIMALECRAHDRYYVKFAFQYSKTMYTGRGTKFPYPDEIYERRVVANGISRKQFEAVTPELEALCEEYRIIQDVRRSLNRSVSSHSSDKAVSIYNSFYSLSNQWEDEFFKEASMLIENEQFTKE